MKGTTLVRAPRRIQRGLSSMYWRPAAFGLVGSPGSCSQVFATSRHLPSAIRPVPCLGDVLVRVPGRYFPSPGRKEKVPSAAHLSLATGNAEGPGLRLAV